MSHGVKQLADISAFPSSFPSTEKVIKAKEQSPNIHKKLMKQCEVLHYF